MANIYRLKVDLKLRQSGVIPTFVQYDTARLEFQIFDAGKIFSLVDYTSVEFAHKKPDGSVLVGVGSIEVDAKGNPIVAYDYQGGEMNAEGIVETSFSLIGANNKKLSIQTFKVSIVKDLREGVFTAANPEFGLLQEYKAELIVLKDELTTVKNDTMATNAAALDTISRWVYDGVYSPTKEYKEFNIVTVDGESYIAKQDSLGETPVGDSNDPYWSTLARKGQDGTGTTVIHKDEFVATAGQTVFTLTNNYTPLTNRLRVLIDGVEQFTPLNFAETANDKFTMVEGLTTGQNVVAVYFSEAPTLANDFAEQLAQMNTIVQHATIDTLQEKADYAVAQGDYAKSVADQAVVDVNQKADVAIANVNTVANENKNILLAPVADFAAIATTYASPAFGSKVQTLNDGKIYRWNGSAWQYVEQMNSNMLTDIQTQLNESARSTSTLVSGSSVVEGDVDTVAEVEFEGRTLTSLANSNLEALKYYALMDKKTKVIVDKNTVAGVGKFVKAQTTLTTGDFVGKVSGSLTANPHVSKHNHSGTETALKIPTGFTTESSQSAYTQMDKLDATPSVVSTTQNGTIAQRLFSFNIIEQIERNLGIIPVATLAEKVQWVKDNVSTAVTNWHGFGSSVGGNKASLAVWNVTGGSWIVAGAHTLGVVTKKSTTQTDFATYMDANGLIHYLAYAEPSDGATASTINTDFINCEITLKSTAQLNTRPTLVRVENFEGKVSGSVVENAHSAVSNVSNTGLMPPTVSSGHGLFGATSYANVSKLDGTVIGSTVAENGKQSQHLFSFNLIEAVERNIGKIPASDVAGKVAWLKANVAKLTANWHGFGSSVGGNKASLDAWLHSSTVWHSFPSTSTSGAVTKVSKLMSSSASLMIDNSGIIHFLAYAEPSDGVTASVINTDYIDLEVELKPTANFTAPKVPLYEVTLDDYNKIGVTWTEEDALKRFPAVEGTQHLTNAYVVAEGENLLPPFTEWTLHANAKVLSAYELELNATGATQNTDVFIPCVPNQAYTLNLTQTGVVFIDSTDANKAQLTRHVSGSSLGTHTITTHASAKFIRVVVTSNASGTFTFKNPMLNLGTTAKPFVPRNPSYLYTNAKLGAIGDKKDILFKQDGQWKLRKSVEKDVALGGDLAWVFDEDLAGNKIFRQPFVGANPARMTAFNGAHGGDQIPIPMSNRASISSNILYVYVSDTHTGFGETYTPSTAEVKAYFYGYQLNNGTFGVPFNGTGTKTWIPLGDTSNARAVTTAPIAPSPTQADGTIKPYRLSYVLATPATSTVTSDVEGSVKVNGSTQFTVGGGMQRTVIDGKSTWAQLSPKSAYTTNPTNVKVTYAKNVRSALEDVTGKTQDNETQLSVHEKAIVNMMVRLKALENA